VAAESELGSGPPSPDDPLALSDAERQALNALLSHTLDEALPLCAAACPAEGDIGEARPACAATPPRAGLQDGVSSTSLQQILSNHLCLGLMGNAVFPITVESFKVWQAAPLVPIVGGRHGIHK
jgi:hypothetical protein